MVRKVFFSFYHKGDSKRIGVVRNHWITKPDRESAGYIDSADWEKLKLKGKKVVEDWIKDQLNGTSLTVVLIGEKTSEREWVKYEIEESYKKGNALLGVYIHNIKGLDEKTTPKGKNPFNEVEIEDSITLDKIADTYDWVNDNGYENFGKWVDESIKKVDKSNNSKLIPKKSNEYPQREKNIEVKTPGQWGY